ncbi:MAG: universal stress protein [Mesorhizobium sp.]|nr:MAG: universal stress protein [Mesorhizobium sp.]
MAHVLIGSTVNAFARTSPVPLLVVKKRVLETQGRAAVATDLSDSPKPALMVGVAMVWVSAVLSCFTRPTRRIAVWWTTNQLTTPSRGKRGREVPGFSSRGVAGADAVSMIEVIVRHGDPVTGLEVLTNEADTDLVIAGTHGRSGLMHALLGSAASRILNDVPCDVLVVPSRARCHSTASRRFSFSPWHLATADGPPWALTPEPPRLMHASWPPVDGRANQ